jgi:hypothetical protein
MSVIGTSSAAEAVSTPLNNVWMTREGGGTNVQITSP